MACKVLEPCHAKQSALSPGACLVTIIDGIAARCPAVLCITPVSGPHSADARIGNFAFIDRDPFLYMATVSWGTTRQSADKNRICQIGFV